MYVGQAGQVPQRAVPGFRASGASEISAMTGNPRIQGNWGKREKCNDGQSRNAGQVVRAEQVRPQADPGDKDKWGKRCKCNHGHSRDSVQVAQARQVRRRTVSVWAVIAPVSLAPLSLKTGIARHRTYFAGHTCPESQWVQGDSQGKCDDEQSRDTVQLGQASPDATTGNPRIQGKLRRARHVRRRAIPRFSASRASKALAPKAHPGIQ